LDNKLRGKILKSTGKWYIVELDDGSIASCRLRGKIRLDQLNTTNPVAVGDRVILDHSGTELMIVSVDKRNNYIVRKSTNLSKQMQILATNIDRAYLLITLQSPTTPIAFIDRFLVATESFRIPTTLLFNKIDIYNEHLLKNTQDLASLYQKVGYLTHFIQANNADSINFLKTDMTGKQVVVSGHSGVGKSTLIKTLDPTLDIKIGDISSAHKQGRHTTTFAQMHKLSFGGYIIDTPGIKAFGMTEIEKNHISHYFPEMRSLLNKCQYNNCKHITEPKCAVKRALEVGEISASRYQTYRQLMEEDVSQVYRFGYTKY